MKKVLSILLTLCFATTLFSGCSEKKATSSENNANADNSSKAAQTDSGLPENYDLVMTFGTETGSVYAMGIQIGEYINRLAPDITCTVKVGAGASNLALLNSNQTIIAHSQSDAIHEALAGEGIFDKPLTDFYGVASVMESVFQVVVPGDAPIDSFADVVEQKYPLKISVGVQGSGVESLFRKILKSYDVTYEDIESWGGKVEYLNIGDASTLYTDGQLNAVAVLAGTPYATVSEISASRDVKLLSLNEEVVDTLCTQGYLKKTIPAQSYTNQEEEINSIGAVVTVCASKDADENVIYEITKFLNSEEGIEILSNVNSGFANYMKGPESSLAGMEVELHPGASRYYNEQESNK